MRETWYVLEDGSVADPQEVAADAKGVLRHRGGKAVAWRGDVPRSRGVDVDPALRDVKPAVPKGSYLTRDSGPSGSFDHDHDGRPGGSARPADADGDLAILRADYLKVFGKRPFAGWDAAALREKIAAAVRAD